MHAHTHTEAHISYKYSRTHGLEINRASDSCAEGMWKIVLVSGEQWKEMNEEGDEMRTCGVKISADLQSALILDH